MARTSTADRGPDDRGGIVIGWLTRIVVIAALVGVALFDAISIGVNALAVEDDASVAARAAGDVWRSTRAVQPSYDEAVRAAAAADPLNAVPPTGFHVDADGTVHVRVERQAATLVLHRIGPLSHWPDVSASGSSQGSR